MKRFKAVWVALGVVLIAGVTVAATFGPNVDTFINGRWTFGQPVKVGGLEVQPLNSAYKITFSATPTANRTVTIPDASATAVVSTLATNAPDVANSVTGASNGVVFEGATANAYETTVSATDPTADRSVVLPDAGGTVMLSSLATNGADAANAVTGTSNGLLFEGATANAYETTLTVTEPTADNTVTIPDGTGTVTLYKRLTHDYGALSASWTLTANEAAGLMLSTTNLGAGGGGDIVAPNDPGKMFIVVNGSGQTHSIKVLGQTGVAIANGKTAIVACNGTDYVRVTADNP